MERGVLRGIAVFRWGAWLWSAFVVVFNREDIARPWIAWSLMSAAFVVTALVTLLLRTNPTSVLNSALVGAEFAIGLSLATFDGLAYGAGHAFSSAQALGAMWSMAAVLTVATARGPIQGVAAGVAMGIARGVAGILNGADSITVPQQLALASNTVSYLLPGLLAGYAVALLRQAEKEISASRARAAIERTLHDGVLQTLAVIARHADASSDLAALARTQDRELREFLYGSGSALPTGGAADLGPELRAAGAKFESTFGGVVNVVLAPDLPRLKAEPAMALCGAVGEALVNAGKHGAAQKVTIYVEPGEKGGVSCSVKDDGSGFDPATTPEGVGLTNSVRARLAEVGGTVEIESRPGNGTVVRLNLS